MRQQTVWDGPMPFSTRPLPAPATPRNWLARYALAAAIVGVTSLIRQSMDPLIGNQVPYFVYVGSAVVATWFCGVGAGIFGTVLAAFVGNYLFVPPRYELVPHGQDWVAMGFFAVVAVGLVALVGRWRRAERVLYAHAHRLQEQAEELRLLHAEAERVSQIKDDFLATLSHELRTPMTAIVGWAHMLRGGTLNGRRTIEACDSILRNAGAQVRLIDDLLDVSRIISGKLHIQLAPLDAAEVVASALDAVRAAAQAKEIEVEAVLPKGTVLVGDADRLRQVAWNLLSNAVKFTPRHGRIEVRVEARDAQVLLTVSDTGVGIEPEFLPHLFERFTQADSSVTRRHGGLGLGLAVVRHITELHGGTVRAESGGKGRGATFTVTLPVRGTALPKGPEAASSAGSQVPAARASELVLEGVKVLVVDDEPDARELVQLVLGQHGADVRVAVSARDAFQEVQQWRPDVLLADIGMPVEDGYSLMRRVRALAAEDGGSVPAAALTAYARHDDEVRALAAGFQEHVAKPVLPGKLVGVVGRLAGRDAESDPN